MRTITSSLAALALLLGWIGSADLGRAEDPEAAEEREPGLRELTNQVANTSIVWIDADRLPVYLESNDGKLNVGNIATLFSDEIERLFTNQQDAKGPPPTAVYDNLQGFALPFAPHLAQATLDELAKLKAAPKPENDEQRRNEILRELSEALAVTADMIVSLSDDACSDKDIKPLSSPVPSTPLGVTRVRGGTQPPGGYVPKVWIIDSGLSNVSEYITVVIDKAANCRARKNGARFCATQRDDVDNQFRSTFVDNIGHGTMLAGIIASKPKDATVFPFFGVAPGANVVPIKVFGSNPETNLSGAPILALDHVQGKASTGDVINVSWGAAWLENMHRRKNQLETAMGYPKQVPPDPPRPAKPGLIDRLQAMSSKFRIVVAAGNIEPAIRPSLASFVFPAALGSYEKAGAGDANMDDDGCRICTVSAIDGNDEFWLDPSVSIPPDPQVPGLYGSNYGRNPPDFAEPGVDIWSLWPGENRTDPNRANMCSGTSFAAAHLSGVFVRSTTKVGATIKFNDPIVDGNAGNDPDVFDPDFVNVDVPLPQDPLLADPIGVATR